MQPHRRLIGEIEIIDRLQKRKVGAPRESRQACLLPMRDLLGDHEAQEIVIRPRLPLGALHEIAPHAPGIGEMQPFEERIEILIGRHHDRPPTRRDRPAVLGRVQVLRCAPPLRAPSATWTRPPRGSGCGRYRRRPVSGRIKGKTGADVAEIVRDVLGADRLLGEPALEGAAERRIAVRLQERVEPLDVVNPDLRAPMRELGEIRQCRRAEIE